jgi:quinol monooxygenase YgiN
MVRLMMTLAARNATDAALQADAFRSLMRVTRLENGCLGCSVQTDEHDRFKVFYVEEWATEEDLRRRVRSPRFTSLLALLETASEPPQVQFDFVTTTSGLEYVAAVRDQAW